MKQGLNTYHIEGFHCSRIIGPLHIVGKGFFLHLVINMPSTTKYLMFYMLRYILHLIFYILDIHHLI
jgi:hypothetical protein